VTLLFPAGVVGIVRQLFQRRAHRRVTPAESPEQDASPSIASEVSS